MSNSIRNTILLLFVLALFIAGSAWYLQFVQHEEIENLNESIGELEAEYGLMADIVNHLPELQIQLEESEQTLQSMEYSLFRNSSPDLVFEYLSDARGGLPLLEFNYMFEDSSNQESYGLSRSTIQGGGTYRSLYHFIDRIENGSPMQKIENLIITPLNSPEEYDQVTYSFSLTSYYNRHFFPDSQIYEGAPFFAGSEALYNPFFPLVRTPEPNTRNLVNVESSRMVGISRTRIFLRDQNGQFVTLNINDRVYLGILNEIDIQNRRALFTLNKGGISETVTLEIQ